MPDPIELHGLIRAVEAAAQKLPSFIGVAWDNTTNTINVYLKGPIAPDISSSLEAIAPSNVVVVHPIVYSFDELMTMTKRVSAQVPSLRERGIILSSWGPNMSSGAVEIQLSRATPSQIATVKSLFPLPDYVVTNTSRPLRTWKPPRAPGPPPRRLT